LSDEFSDSDQEAYVSEKNVEVTPAVVIRQPIKRDTVAIENKPLETLLFNDHRH